MLDHQLGLGCIHDISARALCLVAACTATRRALAYGIAIRACRHLAKALFDPCLQLMQEPQFAVDVQASQHVTQCLYLHNDISTVHLAGDSKTVGQDKPLQPPSASAVSHEDSPPDSAPHGSKDLSSSQQKPSAAADHLQSPTVHKQAKLLTQLPAKAMMAPSQASSHINSNQGITAVLRNESGQSTNMPEKSAQTKDDHHQLQAHPMLQESRGDTMRNSDDRPQCLPARPSSAFAAMAGRAPDASGSLSGSFSRELPYKPSAGQCFCQA